MSGRLGIGHLKLQKQSRRGVTFIDGLARDGGIASIDSTGRRRYVMGANEDVIEERLQCRSIDASNKNTYAEQCACFFFCTALAV